MNFTVSYGEPCSTVAYRQFSPYAKVYFTVSYSDLYPDSPQLTVEFAVLTAKIDRKLQSCGVHRSLR